MPLKKYYVFSKTYGSFGYEMTSHSLAEIQLHIEKKTIESGSKEWMIIQGIQIPVVADSRVVVEFAEKEEAPDSEAEGDRKANP